MSVGSTSRSSRESDRTRAARGFLLGSISNFTVSRKAKLVKFKRVFSGSYSEFLVNVDCCVFLLKHQDFLQKDRQSAIEERSSVRFAIWKSFAERMLQG